MPMHRLGGEEFAIYFQGLDQQGAERQVGALCQRVREDLNAHPVTISIGLTRVEQGDTLSMALVRADQALYEAKHSGKDRFVCWSAQLAKVPSGWVAHSDLPAKNAPWCRNNLAVL